MPLRIWRTHCTGSALHIDMWNCRSAFRSDMWGRP